MFLLLIQLAMIVFAPHIWQGATGPPALKGPSNEASEHATAPDWTT